MLKRDAWMFMNPVSNSTAIGTFDWFVVVAYSLNPITFTLLRLK